MGPGTVQAIIALTQLVSAINELSYTASRITETLDAARSEGRDLTDDELNTIAAETDSKHAEVMALLDRAARA